MNDIERKKLSLPLDKKEISKLKAGDILFLSGPLYTARDAAHKKLVSMIKNGEKLPIELEGETIYYAGPCPARPGEIIGSAGPTTSGRMDRYAPLLLKNGLVGMIGKGKRTKEVTETIIETKGIYLGATGGAGALISQCIKKAEVVAFLELGTEAIRRIYVENFPVIVLTDSLGNDLYEIGKEKYCKI